MMRGPATTTSLDPFEHAIQTRTFVLATRDIHGDDFVLVRGAVGYALHYQ